MRINLIGEQTFLHMYLCDKKQGYQNVKNVFSRYRCNMKILKKDFDGCQGKMFYSLGCPPVIWVEFNKRKDFYEKHLDEIIAIISHESHHAILEIFKFIQEEHYGEIYSMLLEEVMRKSLLYLRSEVCKMPIKPLRK